MTDDYPADAPVLVAACGNPLAADDAFGLAVADRLKRLSLDGVEVIELGMKPADLAHRLAGRRAAVIVDAAKGPDLPPGELIELDFFDPGRPALLHDARLSSHNLSIVHELELARVLGCLPPVVRLVAAPALETQLGSPITASVQSLIPMAVARIVQLARQWNAGKPGGGGVG